MSERRAEPESLSLLTTSEAARLCSPELTPSAIAQAARAGRIAPATTAGPSGLRLFTATEVKRFDAARKARKGGAR